MMSLFETKEQKESSDLIFKLRNEIDELKNYIKDLECKMSGAGIPTKKSIKELISILIQQEKLPKEIICLSCLATQPTARIIANDDACVICDIAIDPHNLSDIEV